MTDVRQLYQKILLNHANYPHHYGEPKSYDLHEKLYNSNCGDTIEVFVKFKQHEIIDISFLGSGCIISQASASMMTDILINHSVSEALELIGSFQNLIMGKISQSAALKDAMVFETLNEFPARVKCAAVSWHAIQNVLQKWGDKH